HDIRLSFKAGLYVRILEIDPFLPLEQLQSKIRTPQVAGNAKQIILLRPASSHHIFGFAFSDSRNADDESFKRRGGITSYYIHTVFFAGEKNSFVQLINGFY